MLSGWKTYLLGAGSIVGAVFAVMNGYMTVEEAASVVLNGGVAMTLRHAISRLGS